MIRALLLACLLPGMAWADTKPRPDMGRIAHAGLKTRAHCTASILEGGHVVTAAHCLPEIAGDQIHFARGYDRGDRREVISALGTEYFVQPERDIAVLCRDETTPGLSLAESAPPPERVTVWGYGRPSVHVLSRKTCGVSQSSERFLLLDCAAMPGASGGPVTVGMPPRLVGVVSRASRSETVVERFSAADLELFCTPSG